MTDAPSPEFTIKVPVALVPGEPGDPLPPLVQNVINALAEFHYWPLDFGEADDKWVELIFCYSDDVEAARLSAKHFIDAGGDV